jgi:hypothetical protein
MAEKVRFLPSSYFSTGRREHAVVAPASILALILNTLLAIGSNYYKNISFIYLEWPATAH